MHEIGGGGEGRQGGAPRSLALSALVGGSVAVASALSWSKRSLKDGRHCSTSWSLSRDGGSEVGEVSCEMPCEVPSEVPSEGSSEVRALLVLRARSSA